MDLDAIKKYAKRVDINGHFKNAFVTTEKSMSLTIFKEMQNNYQ